MTLGIEPFEYVYETSPTNERINWVMSHELLHIVASDPAVGGDRTARKLFFGKVGAHLRPAAVDALQLLDDAADVRPALVPRGDGGVHRDVDGGRLRPRAGRLRRDGVPHHGAATDAHFYDTVGLESEGKAIDFQIGQISYLYGTRFITYLGAHLRPGEGASSGSTARRARRASFRGQFEQVFGTTLDAEWAKWIEWERDVSSSRTSTAVPAVPGDAVRDALGAAARARCRACSATTKRRIALHGGSTTRASSRTSRAIDPTAGRSAQDRRDRNAGALLRHVARLRPGRPGRSSSPRQLEAVARHQRGQRGHRGGRASCSRTRASATSRSTAATRSLWGVRHHNGLSTLVRIAPPYDAGT